MGTRTSWVAHRFRCINNQTMIAAIRTSKKISRASPPPNSSLRPIDRYAGQEEVDTQLRSV